MKFSTPLLRGSLIQRYKRFLADVRLETGETITASCPNTGSMLGLTTPGATVWLSHHTSPTRKYAYAWEMVEADLGRGPTIVGINASRPNAIVREALAAGGIGELAGFVSMRAEVRYGVNSRIDLLLEQGDGRLCYVEIKNVHFSRTAGVAEFPDSVTERGAKHLRELSDMVAAGHRAVMLFLVQRSDTERFMLARDIDTGYGQAFDGARAAGVEALAYACRLSPEGIEVDRPIPVSG